MPSAAEESQAVDSSGEAGEVINPSGIGFPFYLRLDPDGGLDTLGIMNLAYYHQGADGSYLYSPVAGFRARSNGSGHRYALPLFFDWYTPDTRLLLLPTFATAWWRSGDDERLYALNYYRRRARDGSADVLAPLYWHFADAQEQSESYTVGPVHVYSSPEKQRFYVFPFYFENSTPTSSSRTIFPLFHFTDGPRGWSAWFPVGHAAGGETHWRLDLPLVFLGENRAEAWRHILPFYFDYTDKFAHRRLRVAGPLVISERPGELDAGLLPLFWYHRDRTVTAAITPLAGSVHDAQSGQSLWYAGPIFGLGGEHRSTYGVLPLVYFSTAAGGYRSLTILPALHFRTDPAQQTVGAIAGPLAYWRSPALNLTLVPPLLLDFERRDARGAMMSGTYSPLYWRHENYREKIRYVSAGWLYHDYSQEFERSQHLWPIWSRQSREGSTEEERWLNYVRVRTARRDADYFPPLFWRVDDRAAGYRSWAVPPLVYHSERLDGEKLTLTPLGFDYTEPWNRSRISFAGPYFRYRTRDGVAQGVIPIGLQSRNQRDGDTTVLPPLLYTSRQRPDGSGYRVQFPLYWEFNDGRGSTSQAAVPFYWSSERAGGSRYRIGFPLYAGFATTDTSFNMFAPLYASYRGPDRDVDVFVPYFRHSRKLGEKNLEDHILFPIIHIIRADGETRGAKFILDAFGYEKRDGYNRLTLLWAPIDFGRKHGVTESAAPKSREVPENPGHPADPG